ncbi:MAG: hypothetical protein PWQ09_613 [Candidatus Cloacimonadota bacterium]|jgi:hypothetical protein|nr:hypothetical protein [Candidatus Cloacimonadota bacterium]
MKTQDLVARFYRQQVGCFLWLDQAICRIYQAGNFLFGFRQHLPTEIDKNTFLTFFFIERTEIDKFYEIRQDSAETVLKLNEKFHIYNFFAIDPEGRKLEFQTFENWEV